jgi:methylenetetrahydrofolate--tRNA-(uracil-5-)-methyltransferase
MAGLNAAKAALGEERIIFPSTTMLGAMARYVSEGGASEFKPMNANFGVVDPLGYRVKGGKAVKNEALSARSLEEIERIRQESL